MKRLWMICVLLLVSTYGHGELAAQPPTATPAPLNIASPVPPIEEIAPGATPTWTATPEGQVLIEALDVANVRADADPNAAQMGQIRSGEQYTATGRYFEWIQFQFEPNRRGWVFGQLVNVTGNITNLPELGVDMVEENTEEVAATEELMLLTQTPGGLLTATAAARQNTAGGSLPANIDLPSGMMPTFTYPAGLVAGGTAPTQDPNNAIPTVVSAPPVNETTTGGIPPIVPILAFGSIGLLGLLISAIRR